MTKVAADTVVSFHYELRDEQGTLLESSRGREPVVSLCGHGNVIPGLDAALMGRALGERFSVTVAPEQGYGARVEGLRQRVSKKHLRAAARLRPGMQALLDTDGGARPVTVLKVGGSVVDVDLNHPMAGRTLVFEVEVLALREAAPVELAHGHVHGPGGHHH